MKKINYIVVAFMAIIGLNACQDAIEIEQPGRLDPFAAIQTIDDLDSFMVGTYGIMDVSGEIGWTAAFTDEMTRGFSWGGQWTQELQFQLNANSAVSSQFWIKNYRVINQANRLILRAGELEADLTDPAVATADEIAAFNNVVAQARVARAFSHFQLTHYFSPDLTDDTALSVPIFDFVPEVNNQPLRNTNAEAFALINSDLDFALANLTTTSSATFFSIDMVNALKTRIAAERGNYPEVLSLALPLISDYPLSNRTTYAQMFTDDAVGEVIFKLERVLNGPFDAQGATGSATAGGWAGANFAFGGPDIDGSPYMEMDRGLYNLFSSADVRRDVNISPTSLIDASFPNGADYREDDQLIINKYRGSGGRNLMNDLKIFRSSEMLLLAAEAYADAGNFNGPNDSTAALIQDLREARIGGNISLPNYASQQEAFQDILLERRLEFAFEGHRWKDIKRLGVRAGQGVERADIDCEFNGFCDLEATSFKFALPIPLNEINANPGIREQQNTGY